MRIHHIAICITSVIFFTGCALNRHIDYRGSSSFATPTTGITALGAQDQRPYVVNKSKPVDFVGVIRTTQGAPYDMHTSSGEPLADEIGALVIGAFRNNGTNLTQVKIPENASPNERAALFTSPYYLIEMREWQSDVPVNTSFLIYDVSVSVVDANGSVLATKSAKAKDDLGKESDKNNISTAISGIFGGLINDPAIIAAAGRIAKTTPTPPTTEPALLTPPANNASLEPTKAPTTESTPIPEAVATPVSTTPESAPTAQPVKPKMGNPNNRDSKAKSAGR